MKVLLHVMSVYMLEVFFKTFFFGGGYSDNFSANNLNGEKLILYKNGYLELGFYPNSNNYIH